MQRKPTSNTRGPNAQEKRFQDWIKCTECCVCGSYPVILHHAEGSCWRHNKVLCGHWFVLPLCVEHDNIVTHGSRRKFRDECGSQASFWIVQHDKYVDEGGVSAPEEVISAILDWGK